MGGGVVQSSESMLDLNDVAKPYYLGQDYSTIKLKDVETVVAEI